MASQNYKITILINGQPVVRDTQLLEILLKAISVDGIAIAKNGSKLSVSAPISASAGVDPGDVATVSQVSASEDGLQGQIDDIVVDINNIESDILALQSSQGSNVKQMQNLSGTTIPINSPVSKKPDGSIIFSDSDDVTAQAFIGITMEEIVDNAVGDVMLIGPNAEGVITGLGFAPGADIYISESGGFTDDPSEFTGDDDVIIKVGVADCAAGSASATAVDLILSREIVANPSV